ncbi:MAG: GNAT family N-acetyltransferase [Clostridium sp.]
MRVSELNFKLLNELRELFKNNPAQTIVEAVLTSEAGEIYFIYNVNKIVSAVLKIGDFVLIDGDLTGGEQYLDIFQTHFEIISTNSKWYELIEYSWGDTITNRRTILSSDELDEEKIEEILSNIPTNCYLQKINENMAKRLLKENWSRDLVSNFNSVEEFVEKGIGYVLVDGMKVVAGASSFSVLSNGIEVELDVNPNYRRRGYGYIVAAALVNHCIKSNLVPHWDAMNVASIKIAKKLGFKEARTYETLLLE